MYEKSNEYNTIKDILIDTGIATDSQKAYILKA